jgi:hypothetical protein
MGNVLLRRRWQYSNGGCYSLCSQLVGVWYSQSQICKLDQIFKKKYQHLQCKIYIVRIIIINILISYVFGLMDVDSFCNFLSQI